MKLQAVALSFFLATNALSAITGIKEVSKVKGEVVTPLPNSRLIITEKNSTKLDDAQKEYLDGKMTIDALVVYEEELKAAGKNDQFIIGVSDDTSCTWNCVYEKLITLDEISERNDDYIKITSDIIKNLDGTRNYVYAVTLGKSDSEYVKIVGQQPVIGGLSERGYENERRSRDKEILEDFKVQDSRLHSIRNINISK